MGQECSDPIFSKPNMMDQHRPVRFNARERSESGMPASRHDLQWEFRISIMLGGVSSEIFWEFLFLGMCSVMFIVFPVPTLVTASVLSEMNLLLIIRNVLG